MVAHLAHNQEVGRFESPLRIMTHKFDTTGLEIWSCNPADIPEWTPEEKAKLKKALGEIFGWKKEQDDNDQQRSDGPASLDV